MLLGTLQQALTVTISSAANLLIVGVLLVLFVAVAPHGIIGLVAQLREQAQDEPRSPILEATGVTKRFGGFTALARRRLSTRARGERLGLIGPNGSGKSTFVNCITGVLGSA